MPPNAVIGTCSGLFLASDFDGPHQPFKGDPDQPLFAAGYPFFPVRAPKNGSFSSSRRRRRNEPQTRADQLRLRLLHPRETLPTESGRQPIRYRDHLRCITLRRGHRDRPGSRRRPDSFYEDFMAIESQYKKSSSNDRKKRERQN